MKTASIVFLFLATLNMMQAQTVTTVAGSGTCGFANGTGTNASFNGLAGICTNPSGDIFVVDQGSGLVRKITSGGIVSSFASIPGMACGICSDSSGNLYVAGTTSRRIFKVTPTGSVSIFAGGGVYGCTNGTGTLALFGFPVGICSDVQGNIFVADLGCHSVRKITPGGVVTTYAGNGSAGFVNGPGTLASFNGLNGVFADATGNVFVSDGYNHAIRKIDQNGVVSTIAGNGTAGFANGTGTLAAFNAPYSVCGDVFGNLYIPEYNNHVIRKITPAGVVTVFSGNGSPGFSNGLINLASFSVPTGVCIDAQGNYYISEAGNCAVRKITINAIVSISQTSSISCYGLSTGALSSTVTGILPPYTYIWSGNGGNNSTASNLPAGIYTLTVTNSSSITTIQTFTISQPPLLTTSVTTQINPTCYGDTNGVIAVLGYGGTPPYSYIWSTSGFTSATISNLGVGNYSWTTIDSNGCSSSFSVQLTQPSPINLTVLSGDSVICQGESTTLTGNGADSYSWTNGIVNGVAFFPTSTTVYTLTGTNTLTGCSSSLTYTLNVSDCTDILHVSLNTNCQLVVFPNPNNGNFKIKARAKTTLVLLNELGQMVKEISFDPKGNFEYMVSSMENGIYFLTTKGNPIIKQKIVVSK